MRALTLICILLGFPICATEWHVRPGVYTGKIGGGGVPTPVSGVYGAQNGSSYSDAWNGVKAIVWGAGGVQSGDTLTVSGSYIYGMTNSGSFSAQQRCDITNNGTGAILIRSNPDDPAIFWGAAMHNYAATGGAIYWEDVGGGVYYSTNLDFIPCFQRMTDGSVRLLTAQTNSAGGCVGIDGFTSSTNWVYPWPDAGEAWKTNLMQRQARQYSYGPRFFLKTNTHNITFSGIAFNASPIDGEFLDSAGDQGLWQPSTNITFTNCTFAWDSKVAIMPDCDDWTFDGCTFLTNRYHIYAFGMGCSNRADRIRVVNCAFTNSATTEFFDADGHAVGIQGGLNHTISNNVIVANRGSAIEFWNGESIISSGHRIISNRIHTVEFITGIETGCHGIVVSGSGPSGTRTNIVIAGNEIVDTGINYTGTAGGSGINVVCDDPVSVYNNTCFNNYRGVSFASTAIPTTGIATNNAIASFRAVATRTYLGTGTPTNCIIDGNLYWPTNGGSVIHSHTYTFTRDANSLTNDPLWLDPDAGDFRWPAHSPLRAGIGAQPFVPVARIGAFTISTP